MEITLQVEPREGTGKGVARKLRAAGKVPAVLYGADQQATAVTVDRRDLTHALSTEAGKNVLLDLEIGGSTVLTLARQVQRDPVRNEITHVDFLAINRNQAIDADVPVHVIGDSAGVREGGVVEHHVWTVTVSCKPGEVPEFLEADISELGLHEHFKVGDLKAPAGVTIVSDPDEAIVSIVTPQVLEVEPQLETPETAEAGAAPAEGAEGAAGGSGENA